MSRSLRRRTSTRLQACRLIPARLWRRTGSGDSWTIDTNTIGADGDYVVLAGALDDAGNIAGTSSTFNLDTQITTPSVGTIAVDDIVNIAEDGAVAISLSGVDADVVTNVQVTAASNNIDTLTGLPIDTGALVAATGSGDSWTIDTNTIGADGDYVVLVGALDDAGNIAGTSSTFNLDTQITTPSVGTIAVDDIVNIAEDGAVAISLSGVDADVVTNVQVTAASNIDSLTGLPIDTNALVAATGSGDSWTIDINTIGADGDYVVLVGALDDAGNIAGTSSTFNLDTQITTPSVGTIAVDDIVNIAEDGAVAISLSGVDADVVTNVQVTAASNIDTLTGLPIDTGALVAATGSGGSWTIDTNTIGADGDYVVLVGALDDAGNIAGTSSTFNLDTQITTPSVGTIAIDDIVNIAEDGAVAISLSGVDADVVTTSRSLRRRTSTRLQACRLIPARLWRRLVLATAGRSTLNTIGADGDYVVLVGALDDAGNIAGTSSTFNLDTQITTPSVGTIAVDDIVNIAEDGAVAISLSGVDADVVTNVQVTAASNIDTLTGLPIDTGALVAATGSGGSWTIDTNTIGADGDYVVLVGALDDAGNIAGTSSTFRLDTAVEALEGIDIANDTNAQVTTAPEHMLFSGDGNHDAAMWAGVIPLETVRPLTRP